MESVKLSVCWYVTGMGLIRSFFLKLGSCFLKFPANGLLLKYHHGLHNFLEGRAFIPATQISEIHRVMCQEIRVASFSLGNTSFSKNKRTAVPPVDAAAAFVLVKPNPP